jgi:hypothetical protein
MVGGAFFAFFAADAVAPERPTAVPARRTVDPRSTAIRTIPARARIRREKSFCIGFLPS